MDSKLVIFFPSFSVFTLSQYQNRSVSPWYLEFGVDNNDGNKKLRCFIVDVAWYSDFLRLETDISLVRYRCKICSCFKRKLYPNPKLWKSYLGKVFDDFPCISERVKSLAAADIEIKFSQSKESLQ